MVIDGVAVRVAEIVLVNVGVKLGVNVAVSAQTISEPKTNKIMNANTNLIIGHPCYYMATKTF